VWDHEPQARELLEARLSRGWKPTPSALKGAAQILGYSGCMVTRVPHRLA